MIMKNWVIGGKLKTFILLKILQKENISSLPIHVSADFIPYLMFGQEKREIYVNSIEVKYFNFNLSRGMRVVKEGTDILIIYSHRLGSGWLLNFSDRILAIFNTRKLIYLADRNESTTLMRVLEYVPAGCSIYRKISGKKLFTILNTITGEWTIEAHDVAPTQGGVGVLVRNDENYKGWNDILDPLTGKSMLANLKGKRSIQYIDNDYYAIFLKGAGTYSLFNSKTGHEIKLGLKLDWNNPERFKIDKIKEQEFFFLKTKDDETWRIFSPRTEQFIESI